MDRMMSTEEDRSKDSPSQGQPVRIWMVCSCPRFVLFWKSCFPRGGCYIYFPSLFLFSHLSQDSPGPGSLADSILPRWVFFLHFGPFVCFLTVWLPELAFFVDGLLFPIKWKILRLCSFCLASSVHLGPHTPAFTQPWQTVLFGGFFV